MKTKQIVISLIVLISAIILSSCDAFGDLSGSNDDDLIKASGVIEADRVGIAPEFGGKITQIFADEGDQVQKGDVLISLETDLLSAQLDQAQTQLLTAKSQLKGATSGVEAAQAAVSSAELNIKAAELQYQQTLSAARFSYQPIRSTAWNKNPPSEIDLPVWYFQQEELISAAEAEVSSSWDLYQDEINNLEKTLAVIDNDNFLDAEIRLAEAQAAFEVADQLNDRPVSYRGRQDIDDFVTDLYDKAESELEAAQKTYDQLLADPDSEDILEARARVSVARERYEIALDQLDLLYQGEYSREVMAAELQINQAITAHQAALTHLNLAKSNRQSASLAVQQAQSSLDLINLQLDKMQLRAPINGVVLTSTVETGEIIPAGYAVMTIADLSQLTVTVYIPEDRYGQINLGDQADLMIDSFPDEVFEAQVIRISDQAEYTPRNVQTQEERQNTVYAVELTVLNPGDKLKPGMPADVVFQP